MPIHFSLHESAEFSCSQILLAFKTKGDAENPQKSKHLKISKKYQ